MATQPNTTFPWPGKPVTDTTAPSVIATDFADILDRLEYLQQREARHAVAPFSLKQLDLLDERWSALMQRSSPKSARAPLRLGDAVLLQARMLVHLVTQMNDAEDHATIAAALCDLTQAAADRVPPTVHALLERALTDVADGYTPTVYPETTVPPSA
jgi:hypothetical protein